MTAPEPSTELLALLDAGALDPDRAARVRAAADGDERATAVLDALARTRAALASLPPPPVPDGAAGRWAHALAQLPPVGQGAVTPVTPPSPVRRAVRRPDPRRSWVALVAVTAGAVLAVVAAAAGLLGPQRPTGGIVAVTTIELEQLAAGSLGVRDLGELSDPARLTGCMARVAEQADVDPDAGVVAGRRVLLDGREGILLLVLTGERGRFDVVVVDPECGPDGGMVLITGTIG